MPHKIKGTSGNRPGYKIFSFNTSVRNPKRNEEFLKAFIKFDGKTFDKNASHAYLCELVRGGIYQFTSVPENIKKKWEANIDLTNEEVQKLIDENPQATGEHNRIMTSYMRALRDQGFLCYEDIPSKGKYHIIKITKMGHELIDEEKDISIVYTKVMIGLHAKNPARNTMYNCSRPFLNALFVINRVNEIWKEKGKDPKGVLRHEFAAFILSMKDCDYEKSAQEIIKYRSLFKSEVNMAYINTFLLDNKVLPLAHRSICNDYPDDVFRKFEMTGLISSHGYSKYIYYNISSYNKEKADQILDLYKNYKFEEFSSAYSYNEYLSSVKVPWEKDLELRKKIAKTKAIYLGREFNDSISLDEEELQIDRAFYTSALEKAICRYEKNMILKELLILSGIVKEKSKFNDIAESLRLEYLLALAIGKSYGLQGLVSNIIYNEIGEPMHCALGKKCDILFFREEGSLILEPTMLRTRDQQIRNETTAINRHLADASGRYNQEFKVLMIAPKVHRDTIDYFTYRSKNNNLKMVTLTISKFVGLLDENIEYNCFLSKLDELLEYYKNNESSLDVCTDYINSYKPNEKIYMSNG